MPLPPGTRLGPYEIVVFIDAGGMGEVYRARDTKLRRDVALKILPVAFASDAQRVGHSAVLVRIRASASHELWQMPISGPGGKIGVDGKMHAGVMAASPDYPSSL
jgi:serine/threonine protein kinase